MHLNSAGVTAFVSAALCGALSWHFGYHRGWDGGQRRAVSVLSIDHAISSYACHSVVLDLQRRLRGVNHEVGDPAINQDLLGYLRERAKEGADIKSNADDVPEVAAAFERIRGTNPGRSEAPGRIRQGVDGESPLHGKE